jgi:mycothiol synthase
VRYVTSRRAMVTGTRARPTLCQSRAPRSWKLDTAVILNTLPAIVAQPCQKFRDRGTPALAHREKPARLRATSRRRYNPRMNTLIAAAVGDRRTVALRLLFARFPVEEQEARLREALLSADRGTLKLDDLLLAESDGLAVGAALVMVQPDGVALVWPPVISCGAVDETAVEDRLMEEVCRRIDAAGARLGQCLLAPDDVAEADLLRRHGFEPAAEMFFLARPLSESDATRSETAAGSDGNGSPLSNGARETSFSDVRIERYRDDISQRFERVIEESYQGSLDCPFLTGFRNGVDAIASHKLPGVFDPDRWTLYSVGGRDAGVVLLNDHPDQDAVEIVYLGVTPTARGRRLGRRMLDGALSESARRGRAVIFLSVDCENSYATSLYRELGFEELARRRILLRRPS